MLTIYSKCMYAIVIAVVILSAIVIITKLAYAVLRAMKLRDQKQLTVSSIGLIAGSSITIVLACIFIGDLIPFSSESADCSAHAGNLLLFGKTVLSLGFAATLYLCVKAGMLLFRKAKHNGWKDIIGMIFLFILALSTQCYSVLEIIITPL